MSDDQVTRHEYEKLYEKVDSLDQKVDEINRQLMRQKGFIGGILFVASSFAALVTLVWQAAKFKFFGGG